MMRSSFYVFLIAAASAFGQDRLTLEEAERTALQQHPRLRSAQHLTDAARAQVQQVKGTLQPFLAGNITSSAADHLSRIGAGGLNASSLFTRFGAGIAVTQNLWDFGRTNKLADSVSSRADSQAALQDTVRAQILLEVRQAYIRVLGLQRSLAVSRSAVETRELARKQISALVDSQLRSTLDLQFAEVAVGDAEVTVARLEGDLSAAQAILASTLGFTQDKTFVLAEVVDTYALPDDAGDLVREALAARPEVAVRRLQSQAAKQFAESERRLIYPSVSSTGVFGFIPAGDERLRKRYGGLGINLNVPVFNGRTFQARRTEAESRAASAEQDTHEAELRVARDVRTAFVDAANAKRRIGLSEKQLAHARRLYGMAETRYRSGLGTIVEVNQAEFAKLNAELSATSARYEYYLACGVLDFATGRLR